MCISRILFKYIVLIINYIKLHLKFIENNNLMNVIESVNKLGIGDWGLGIGDWGLGIGPNPQSPIPIEPSINYLKNELKIA